MRLSTPAMPGSPRTMRRALLLAAALGLAPAAVPSAAAPPDAARMTVDRVVMVMRHGVRAPLDGEVPAGTRTAAPWPAWPVGDGRMTPRGMRAMAVRGRADRAWLAATGLVARRGCPAAGTVRVWTNVSPRTIDSGAAFASGFAPGCRVPVGHLDAGAVDPLFESLRAGGTGFDPAAAIAAIDRHTGGMNRLVQRHARALADLDAVLGCGGGGTCTPGAPAALRPSPDGRGIDLDGPIRRASGIAQVLLLQHAQGMPARDVGWGRADAATIERLGALHAALFDVFTRPPYMAAHQAGPLGRRVIAMLTAPRSPALDLLMGHDTNVTALAAALRVDLVAPGYARNDTAPGGALVLERAHDATGVRFVRLLYRAQSPDTIRRLGTAVASTPLAIPGCTTDPRAACRLDRFVAMLSAQLGA